MISKIEKEKRKGNKNIPYFMTWPEKNSIARKNVSDGGDGRTDVRSNESRWMGMMREGSWQDDFNLHRLDRRSQLLSGLRSRDLSQFFGLGRVVGPPFGTWLGLAHSGSAPIGLTWGLYSCFFTRTDLPPQPLWIVEGFEIGQTSKGLFRSKKGFAPHPSLSLLVFFFSKKLRYYNLCIKLFY